MDRRNFIKSAVLAGAVTVFNPFKKVLAETSKILPIKEFPDLVGVKDGSPAQMFEIAIKAFGGMERFVKKGQTVLVKPNIGWDRTPTQAANTNPELVGVIVKKCYEAGAKKVFVFDHTCDEESACLKNSGIKAAAERNRAEVLSGNNEKDYREVEIKGAKVLKKAKFHKTFLDSDVVINVPILKNHSSTRVTSAMKNLMGVVWDRRAWHHSDLQQCIADVGLVRKIDLNIVDAYVVMTKNGPRGLATQDLKMTKMQILSPDMVLADSAACKILGFNPSDIAYLTLGQELGVGSKDLEKAQIKKLSCKV